MLVGTRSAARALQKSREHLKCQTTAGCRRDTCGAPKRHAFSACPPNFGKASHIRYGADLSQARWARKPRSLGGPRSQEIDQRSRHRNGLARKAANTAFLMCRAPWKTAPHIASDDNVTEVTLVSSGSTAASRSKPLAKLAPQSAVASERLAVLQRKNLSGLNTKARSLDR